MTKLLSSFLPVVGRGGGGGAISEDAPVSILLHVFGGQPVVIALCADLNLRLWSVQVCCDLLTYVPLDLCTSLAAGSVCDYSQFVSVCVVFQCWAQRLVQFMVILHGCSGHVTCVLLS